MVRTIDNSRLEVNKLEAFVAALGRALNTSVDRRDEFLRNHAADDAGFKFVALAGFVRRNLHPAVTILAVTTGLTDETAFSLDRLADGRLVGNLGACQPSPRP